MPSTKEARTLVLALAVLAGCGSTTQPSTGGPDRRAPDAEPRDARPDDPPPQLGKVEGGGTLDGPDDLARALEGAGDPRSTAAQGSGLVQTILYVTTVKDTRRANGERPAAMVFSSDKDSPFMDDTPRASRILKAVSPAEMQRISGELDATGLSSLPFRTEPPEDPIPPNRAIYVFRDGKRQCVRKEDLDLDNMKLFKRVEEKLIHLSRQGR